MIAAAALLLSLLALLVSAYLWLEIVDLSRKVRAAMDEMRERQDLFFAIQETERKIKQ
jgi:hypothetical protein